MEKDLRPEDIKLGGVTIAPGESMYLIDFPVEAKIRQMELMWTIQIAFNLMAAMAITLAMFLR